jgi:aldose 1-epimerase
MTEGPAFQLWRGPLSLDVDRRGAVITGLFWTDRDGRRWPLMRAASAYCGDPLKSSCFPLLPFCNRVDGNRFIFGGRVFDLTPNQPWDRHYLHGDGWLSCWDVEETRETSVELALTHAAKTGQPYAYHSRITYELTDSSALAVQMEIRNDGAEPLPFGLGLHPYFPLTPRTELQAPARSFFEERADFMPGGQRSVPSDVDFSCSRTLPRRWINNGFTGWSGQARIAWPEARIALHITADDAFGNYFVFIPDARFEPSFNGDYFCFEPMTHQANGHHAVDLGGLVVLAPGEAMRGRVLFRPEEMLA